MLPAVTATADGYDGDVQVYVEKIEGKGTQNNSCYQYLFDRFYCALHRRFRHDIEAPGVRGVYGLNNVSGF